jgi:hypothetical protein
VLILVVLPFFKLTSISLGKQDPGLADTRPSPQVLLEQFPLSRSLINFSCFQHFVVWLLVLFVSGKATAQDSLPRLPANTEFLIHLENVSALSAELKWFRSSVESNDRLKEILIGEPQPLLSAESLSDVYQLLESIETVIDATEQVTIAVGNLKQEPVYLLLLKVDENKISESLEALEQAWASLNDSLSSELEDVAESHQGGEDTRKKTRDPGQLPPIDLVSEASKGVLRFLPRKFHRVGEYLIVSNSQEWQKWMEQALANSNEPVSKPSLQHSRRFQRSMALLTRNQSRDGFCWFLPYTIFPLWDSKLTQDALKKLGYEEMVGASVDFGFGSHIDSSYRFRLKMSVPFTVPEEGVVRLWKSYRPITKIPPVADYISKSQDSPWTINVTNLDRQEYIRIHEAIYVKNGEVDKFKEKYQKAAQYYPSMESFISLYDGSKFRLTMRGTRLQPQNYTINFAGIYDQNVAEEYLDYFAKVSHEADKDYQMQKVVFGGYPARFYSEEDALKMAAFNFGRKVDLTERHLLRNVGILLTPRWIVTGDRNQIEEYFEEPMELEVDASQEIHRLFPAGNFLFESIRPSVVDISFPDRWLQSWIKEFRVKYLSTKMSPHKAGNLVFGSANGDAALDFIPLETHSDRIFSVWDWGLDVLLTRYNSGIQMFSPQEGHFEWQWYVFEKQ